MKNSHLNRREYLQTLTIGAFTGCVATWVRAAQEPASNSAGTRDVPWLAEVTEFPTEHVAAAEREATLSPLWNAAQPPVTDTAWRQWQRDLRSRWEEFLGPLERPDEAQPTIHVVLEEALPTNMRRKLRWEVEPGVNLEAWLLIPKPPAPRGGYPAIVALHPTSTLSIDEIAGLRGNAPQQRGPALAEAGYVVICPRNFLWQDAPDYAAAVANFRKRHPRALGMRKMLVDARQGVNVLERLEIPINRSRIGCFGHSLGAKEVLYLMALDERLCAGVASDGGIPFGSTNWDAPWYLGQDCETRARKARLDHHQLLALAAPRPLLIVAGGHERGGADGDRTRPYITAAQAAYRLRGSPCRLGLWNHQLGHSMADPVWARCREWLLAYV